MRACVFLVATVLAVCVVSASSEASPGASSMLSASKPVLGKLVSPSGEPAAHYKFSCVPTFSGARNVLRVRVKQQYRDSVRPFISARGVPHPSEGQHDWTVPLRSDGSGHAHKQHTEYSLVTVYDDDSRWPADGLFYVSVFATDAQAEAGVRVLPYMLEAHCDQRKLFEIDATTVDADELMAGDNVTVTRLHEGMPVTDSVSRTSGPRLFNFTIDADHGEGATHVRLEALTGDADLYVSYMAMPTRFEHQWASNSVGSDDVVLYNASAGWYGVAVYAFDAMSDFTLELSSPQANGSDSGAYNTTWVSGGVPVTVRTSEDEATYFSYWVQPGTSMLSVAVNAMQGGSALALYASTAEFPTPMQYMWTWTVGEALELSRLCTECQLNVLVVSSAPALYELTLSTSWESVRLDDSMPTYGYTMPSNMSYYMVQAPSSNDTNPENTALVVSLTTYTGETDLFMSVYTHYPNSTNYQWTSQRLFDDRIVVNMTDMSACLDCTYSIGVYCSNVTYCTYEIMAQWVFNSSEPEPVYLYEGYPQDGVVTAGEMAQYVLAVEPTMYSSDAKVVFDVTTYSGDVNLYVSLFGTPTRDNYTWSSEYGESSFVLEIDLSDVMSLGLCNLTDPSSNGSTSTPMCTFFAGVEGVYNSSFVITASVADGGDSNSNSTHTQLFDSSPLYGSLDRDSWQYYRFDYYDYDPGTPEDVCSNATLKFTVTRESGDPDLFVSAPPAAVEYPSNTSYTKASMNWADDYVEFSGRPGGDLAEGTYYLGVYAYVGASYTISVSTTCHDGNSGGGGNSSVVQLSNGTPQHASQGAYSWSYFEYELANDHTGVTFKIVPMYGRVSMFVGNDGILPTLSHFKWSGREDVIIGPSSPAGVYLIGVYSSEASGFSIVATPRNSYEQLAEGEPVVGLLVAPGELAKYRFMRASSDSDVRVIVSTRSGDPALCVSNVRLAQPDPASCQWLSNNPAGQPEEINAYSNMTSSLEFFIYVTSQSFNTSFSLVLTESMPNSGGGGDNGNSTDVIELTNGMMQDFGVSDQLTFFVFRASNNRATIKALFQVVSGDSITAYMGKGYQPGAAEYDWSDTVTAIKPAQVGVFQSSFSWCGMYTCDYYFSAEAGANRYANATVTVVEHQHV